MRLLSAVSAALPLLLCAACNDAPAAVRPGDILQERAIWAAHHLSRYTYVYEITGFFTNVSGRPIRLVVLNDSVVGAQDLATDSILPVTGAFPTVDGLFAQAIAAQVAGSLTAIAFDSTLGFPVRMDLAGPPDAAGSVLASNVEPVP